MANPLRVDPKKIGELDPYEAVALAARIIRADASASGIPSDSIDIPSNITAPDGGVDGTCRESPRPSLHGLVKEGYTTYLFHAGRFRPGTTIPRMLLTRQGDIKARIRSCIEKGGTLVVVLFGWDGTAKTDGDAVEERFKKTLAESSYPDVKVDVWGQNRIAAVSEKFVQIALDINGAAGSEILSHGAWARLADMAPAFRHGSAEDGVVEQIREHVRGSASGPPAYLRVSGEPGSGKTRIVLEAMRAADLAPLVAYAADPAAARGILDELASSRGGGTILVVDECDWQEQAWIWNRLGAKQGSTHLVTICNEAGAARSDATDVEVADMHDEQIAEIIAGYAKVKSPHIEKWVEYSRPSPRAAHIVGSNLAASPNDMHRPPGNVMVWERWISGQRDIGGGDYNDRLTVMLWLSLFTKFGFDEPYEGDTVEIARLVGKLHPDITEYRFREVVRTMRRMKVLQGSSILYITPRILHEYLWLRWWERYGPGDAPSERPRRGDGGDGDGAAARAAGSLPALYSRYCDMLERMGGKNGAGRVAERILGSEAESNEGRSAADALASRLLAAAYSVNPAAALSYAKGLVKGMPAGQLQSAVRRDRHRIIANVRPMLESREAFAGAAGILLALAAAEDDGKPTFGSGAGDAFCSAFDPAPGAGPAGIPLAERLGALAGAMRGEGIGGIGGGGARARQVAVRACGAVLRMERFSPAAPKRLDFGRVAGEWAPDNRAELGAYLQGVLALLDKAATECREEDGGIRDRAAQAILGSLRQAAILPEIAEGAVDAAERACAAGLADGEALLAEARHLAAHESHRIGPGTLDRINAIIGRADAQGLHVRLARCVGRETGAGWSRFGTEEGWRDEAGRLAAELAADPAAFDGEIAWLASDRADADGARLVGYLLAAHDKGCRIFDRIMKEVRRARDSGSNTGGGGSGCILVGYVAWMCKGCPGRAEDVMDEMRDDAGLCRLLPDIVLASGSISDRSARRLVRAVGDGRLDREALARIGPGRPFRDASEEAFCEVVRTMMGGGGGGHVGDAAGNGAGEDRVYIASAALGMLCRHYLRGQAARPLHEETALAVLLHADVLGGPEGCGELRISSAAWAETALALVRQGSRKGGAAAAAAATAARLAKAVLCRLGSAGLFESDLAVLEAMPVLDEIARLHPREAWEAAASYMGPPVDARAGYVRAWLGGRTKEIRRAVMILDREQEAEEDSVGGGIRSMPISVPLDWAAKDAQRPRLLAGVMPPDMGAARQLLVRFGGSAEVRDELVRAFEGEGGAALAGRAGRLKRRLGELEAARRGGEPDPNVAAWLDGYIGHLKARIAAAGGGGGGGGSGEEGAAAGPTTRWQRPVARG